MGDYTHCEDFSIKEEAIPSPAVMAAEGFIALLGWEKDEQCMVR